MKKLEAILASYRLNARTYLSKFMSARRTVGDKVGWTGDPIRILDALEHPTLSAIVQGQTEVTKMGLGWQDFNDY